jgi:hypothetical protein
MRVRRISVLSALALAACTQPAWAFLDPPYITPANPTVDDPIFVNVYGGECDVLNIGIVPPAIEQHGADITILFAGIHESDPEFCYYGIGTSTYPVGTFPPGAYTRRVIAFACSCVLRAPVSWPATERVADLRIEFRNRFGRVATEV